MSIGFINIYDYPELVDSRIKLEKCYKQGDDPDEFDALLAKHENLVQEFTLKYA